MIDIDLIIKCSVYTETQTVNSFENIIIKELRKSGLQNIELSGYIDSSNIVEGGDLRLTIFAGSQQIDLDIKGNEFFVAQVQENHDNNHTARQLLEWLNRMINIVTHPLSTKQNMKIIAEETKYAMGQKNRALQD